jgi:hypothetical protein
MCGRVCISSESKRRDLVSRDERSLYVFRNKRRTSRRELAGDIISREVTSGRRWLTDGCTGRLDADTSLEATGEDAVESGMPSSLEEDEAADDSGDGVKSPD